MNEERYAELIAKAKEKDARELDRLWELYCCTDMPEREYLAHLRIIAEGRR